MAIKKNAGYTLPVNPDRQQGKVAQGFVTPQQDKLPQVHAIPPRRVLPIVFIPGIMGSNLRMSVARRSLLGNGNNIAWRPDNLRATLPMRNESPAQRQMRLDPAETEVDTYDPQATPIGSPKDAADIRHDEVRASFVYAGFNKLDGPLLQSDLSTAPGSRTKDQKARARGWGEVYFSSYQEILVACEVRLNGAFFNGIMDPYLRKFVAGIAPSTWQAHPEPALAALDEKTMSDTVKGCWFPVHAMGYNWLHGNGDSGIALASRISELIENYKKQGFQCEKVILVTHSMGGLVARAIIHPELGNINDKVLGIVHGVMPAVGAGAAYKRMRCGFEGSGISAKVLGEIGSHVTAVLANSQGGLELLPSEKYGNDWLQVKQKGLIHMSLPKHGDPYEEIYKQDGKWFGLIREEWINPAARKKNGLARTYALLDKAKAFHRRLEDTYHVQSYAHYGADSAHPSWHKVVWEIDKTAVIRQVELLRIASDDAKGKMTLVDPSPASGQQDNPISFGANLLDPIDPGDQTVPLHSADAQFRSRKFKGLFRQSGYEHQSSYSDSAAIASTIYSLFKIASTMKWSVS